MMKTFPLLSRAKTTALKQPKELFSMARDADGTWITDDEEAKKQISYYYLPDAAVDGGINLQAGFSNFRKMPDADNLPNFPAFLDAIHKHEQEHGKIKTDIVTFRGIMTTLLTLPYNMKDDFVFDVVAFDGQLFIGANKEFQMKKWNNESDDDYRKRCEFSGYKFEAVATLPKPWAECSRALIENRKKSIVSTYEQYVSVVKTGIGKVRLLLAGEVDCVYDYVPDNYKGINNHYMELKTSTALEQPGQVVNFEKKLFRTWAQSFLLGVTIIAYGFRDKNLMLQGVELYKTDEVPVLIKDNPLTNNQANKINCMNALKWYGAVLEWLNDTIDKSNEKVGYKLQYDSGSRTLSLMEISAEENKALRNGGILNEEFVKWRKNLKEEEKKE